MMYRATSGGVAVTTGSSPVAPPNGWLRLQRVGSVFNSYTSYDGLSWQLLGSVTQTMPATLHVGMASASRNVGQAVAVSFRDSGNVTAVAAATVPSYEPLGPSSRKTGLAISEIMYHPRPTPTGAEGLQFVEIFNSLSIPEDISAYSLDGDIQFTFPTGTVIPAGGFLVVGRYPAELKVAYNITNVAGSWGAANLSDNGGTLLLRGRVKEVLLEVPYESTSPWPVAAAGAGHSLALARPSYGEGDSRAWQASDVAGGSPGSGNPFTRSLYDGVLINEFRANSGGTGEDFIELYNGSGAAVSLAGCYLAETIQTLHDATATNRFRIPTNVTIPAGGFVYFTESEMNNALKSDGGTLYLLTPDLLRVINVLTYEGQSAGMSSGRWPDGGTVVSLLSHPTPGAANAAQWRSDVVINELMFNPPSGNNDEEFVELYNRGTNTISLAGWRFTAGITFTFPADVQIGPGQYKVVARNMANLLSRYPGTLSTNGAQANLYGNYSGQLANGGERLALARPEYNITTNSANEVKTNTIHVVVNEVTYGDGGRWGAWTGGGGSSLELMDPHSDNRLSANWTDSDESAKGQWTTIDFTGANDGAQTSKGANDNLHIYLLGVGEFLLDDVEVINTGTSPSNLITNNADFELGLTGWTPQGSHDQSIPYSPGYNSSSKCLLVRAGSRGDPGVNKLRSPTFGTTASSIITMRCKARWLRGYPEMLMRMHGGGIEAVGRLPIPNNLGTPGQQNSQYRSNLGPAMYEVAHAPVLPMNNEAVTITARATDPDGVANVTVFYRVDPATTFTPVPMVDTGANGDAVANDGLYTATLPPQTTGTTIAFYVQATDGAPTPAATLFPKNALVRDFPNDSPSHECLIRYGETLIPGGFATYRLWTSTATANRWAAEDLVDATHTNPELGRDRMDNAQLDATFVYNNCRVVYNMGANYAGSPWHQAQMDSPTGADRTDFVMVFPDDDRFLGASDFVLNTVGNPGGTTSSDTSGQAEQTSYIMFRQIGLHYNYRRYIHLFVNGNQRSTTSNRAGNFIMEDSQQPNGDALDEWYYNDTQGDLYKIEDWFEFTDSACCDGSAHVNDDADLTRRTTTYGGATSPKTAAYRFMWRKRAVAASESASNYSEFYKLLDAVSPASAPTAGTFADTSAIDAVANIDQWMRSFAVQRVVGNWDSYGWERGKNGYTYKAPTGRFEMMTWDIDFTVGVGGRAATDANLFNTTDPRVAAMYATPLYRRFYLRGFYDLINGPMQASYITPILDAKAAAFAANNVNVDPATVSTIKTYLNDRRNYLLGVINSTTATNFTVRGTNYLATNNNMIVFTGTAPVQVDYILVNGYRYPLTWSFNNGVATDPTGWTIRYAVDSGTNRIVFTAYDRTGKELTYLGATNTVVYTGPSMPASEAIVFNEVMYNSTVTNGGYVELYNRSTNIAFNLTGWRINGLGYTFPAGSLLGPTNYLLLVEDRAAFSAAYGSGIQVFDQFPGQLQTNGETLTLLRPGAEAEEVVQQFRYDSEAPWPKNANGGGAALQLVDARQDLTRVANWSDGTGWRFYSYSGTISGPVLGKKIILYPDSGGEVYIDDMTLVTGSVPAVGTNLITDGGFEGSGLFTNQGGAWGYQSLFGAQSQIDTNVMHTGKSSMHLVFTNAGSTVNNISMELPIPNTTYTFSFWYLPASNINTLTFRVTSLFQPKATVRPNSATPATANSVAQVYPTLPKLWLNEVSPQPLPGVVDNLGESEPWIELYNSSTNSIALGGLYLTDDYANPTKFMIPTGTVITAEQHLIIWTDGETNETTAGALHTNFRLGGTNGTVGLFITLNSSVLPLDYLNWRNMSGGRTYGAVPDGQAINRQRMDYPTPQATNNPALIPFVVQINEWMSDNANLVAIPGTTVYEDWFELYNPGEEPVDLAGWFLTDNPTNWSQFQVPVGYVLPPHSYLVVWADNNTVLNTGSGNLHVNFRLSRSGEWLGIYDPEGRQVDLVPFAAQSLNGVNGRYPDGAAPIMTLASPTPGAANLAGNSTNGNTAPVLAPLGSHTLLIGQSLAVTAQAADSDLPVQQLTFQKAGGPALLTVNATSGLINWTPVVPEVGTHVIPIIVTDSGTPALSASNNLTVIVGAQPRFNAGGVTVSGTQITFSLPTVTGKTYQVQYQDRLGAAWLPLGTTHPGTGTPLTLNDTLRTNRFYRVVVGD
jgi:hypothetical protein